jgi:hypothetical protein
MGFKTDKNYIGYIIGYKNDKPVVAHFPPTCYDPTDVGIGTPIYKSNPGIIIGINPTDGKPVVMSHKGYCSTEHVLQTDQNYVGHIIGFNPTDGKPVVMTNCKDCYGEPARVYDSCCDVEGVPESLTIDIAVPGSDGIVDDGTYDLTYSLGEIVATTGISDVWHSDWITGNAGNMPWSYFNPAPTIQIVGGQPYGHYYAYDYMIWYRCGVGNSQFGFIFRAYYSHTSGSGITLHSGTGSGRSVGNLISCDPHYTEFTDASTVVCKKNDILATKVNMTAIVYE